MEAGTDSSRRRVPRWVAQSLPGALMAALSMILYLGALRIPFVYDDRITVVENPSIRQLRNIDAVLRFNLFRPVVNVSFAVDHGLWGLNPVGFHLTNVVLHALNVALLFMLLARIVQDCRIASRGAWDIGSGPARLIALVPSALFAVHPMMTEAVGYVSGRSDVLAGTFFLLAFLLMRTGLETGHARWIALSLVPFALGLASKEVSVMFPFVVLAYDRLILRRSGREFRRHLLRVHLPLIGAVVLLGAARVVVFVMVESAVASVAPARMLGYLTAQLGAIWKYVQLLMLPLHQSIAHNATGRVAQVLGAIVLGATCVLAFRLRKRAPLASFGVTWFLLLLLPSSSVVPLQSAIAEHRVYLASIGLFLVAGTGFAWVVQRLEGRPIGLRILLYAEGVFALAGLAALTAARHVVWTNPVALWREATINAPRWDTYTALGNALRDAGDCETALVAYAAASRVEPERLVPVAAAWACLTILGRSDEAREIARRVRRGDPQLTRLCQDVHALAPHMVSVQACVEQFDRAFGPGADG